MNANIELDSNYNVQVIKILTKGIIVELTDYPDETAFIHISKISTKFVDDVNNFVKLGDTFEAKGISSDISGIELSLLHLDIQPAKYRNTAQHNTYKSADSLNNTKAKLPKPSKSSIDSMIEAANDDYLDKQRALSSRRKRRLK